MPILLPHQNIKTSIISVVHSKKNNLMGTTQEHIMKRIFQKHTKQKKRKSIISEIILQASWDLLKTA